MSNFEKNSSEKASKTKDIDYLKLHSILRNEKIREESNKLDAYKALFALKSEEKFIDKNIEFFQKMMEAVVAEESRREKLRFKKVDLNSANDLNEANDKSESTNNERKCDDFGLKTEFIDEEDELLKLSDGLSNSTK